MQALEVLVEGVAQVALEAGGARGHDEAASDGQPAVDHTEQQGEPGQRGEVALAPALDGTVDDALDHQWDEHAGHHSSQGGQRHGDEVLEIRPREGKDTS